MKLPKNIGKALQNLTDFQSDSVQRNSAYSQTDSGLKDIFVV